MLNRSKLLSMKPQSVKNDLQYFDGSGSECPLIIDASLSEPSCFWNSETPPVVHNLILRNALRKILLLFCMFVVLTIQGSPVLQRY